MNHALMGAEQQKEYIGALSPRQQTQREQLTVRKSALESQLERVNHALEMLDKYPDFEIVMNAVMQANY